MANKLSVGNIATQERVEISNGVFKNGIAYYLSKSEPKPKWCEKYHVNVTGSEEAGAYTKYIIEPQEGWDFIVPVKEAKASAPKASKPKAEKKEKSAPKKVREAQEAIKAEAQAAVEEAKEKKLEKPEQVWKKLEEETNKTKQEVLASAAEIVSEFIDPEVIRQELAEKYGSMGADIFEAAMKIAGLVKPVAEAVSVNENQVRNICEEYFKGNKAKAGIIEVKSAAGVGKIEGVTNKDFEIFVNLVNAGKPLYMYGPAGSGKSYTAKQIADALKLDYYETSQALFAHELKGYGDAAGKFVETAFYRAFANGGVFFLDEVDASAPEALVVLNNAIANKRFDFPVIGNVNAHENFRVIAAGNTRMTGATMEYTARQMQDTSFKNRFFFATVTYDRSIFLALTGGDEEIVSFGEDLRRAARNTGISQLFSYRQASDLATLQECCKNNDAYLLRGSVLQEKTVDDAVNLYEHLTDKSNRWAKAMKRCIEEMRTEEVW